MKNQNCTTCQTPKTTLQCGLCHESLCKACAQFLEEETFSFLTKIPAEAAHSCYCGNCYTEKVVPLLESYQQMMEKAKNVAVYNKHQGKETRLVKRLERPIQVLNCPDHNEAVLRLAFLAAQMNYDAIVDVELKSEKIKNGSYQTTRWSGTAIPAVAPAERIIKDRSSRQSPN